MLDLSEIRAACPRPSAWPPPPDWFDLVVVACSDGKDSRVLLHQAWQAYPRERLWVVYHLLGNEHPGSPFEVAAWYAELGLPLYYTWKDEANCSRFGTQIPPEILRLYEADWLGPGRSGGEPLPAMVEAADLVVRLTRQRGMWPSAATPFCTDRGKAQTSDVLLNHLAMSRGVRKVLLLTGERREESAVRQRKSAWYIRNQVPSLGRLILGYRPLLDWDEPAVWAYLRAHGLLLPASYGQGFSRHSCSICIHATWPQVVLAFSMYPGPAARRVAAEAEVGHWVVYDARQPSRSRYYYEREGTAYYGYRAAWEYVYGPWQGRYRGEEVRAEAQAALERWRAEGYLFALPMGNKCLEAIPARI